MVEVKCFYTLIVSTLLTTTTFVFDKEAFHFLPSLLYTGLVSFPPIRVSPSFHGRFKNIYLIYGTGVAGIEPATR